MTCAITRIDPFDDDAVDAWWDVYAAAERADRGPDTIVWTREETRKELQQRTQTIDRRVYLARLDEEVIGAGGLALPLADNTHLAQLAVYVLPGWRRQRIGSQILEFVEGEATASARTTAEGLTSWPYSLGPDGAGTPGREFARSHGYSLALGDLQSRLSLPLDAAALEIASAGLDAAISGYVLHSWVGPVPEAFVEGWATLDAAVETEAPTGERNIEPTTADASRIRENEALLVQQNRTSYGTIALAADGSAAAFTQLVVSGDDGNAYQWGTLVRGADRGHRLGTAVKLANLRMLQREDPAVPTVYTYNADSNTHMLAVNTLLGFTPSERMGELQKQLR